MQQERTVEFDGLGEVTIVFDPDTEMLSALTDNQMIGSLFTGVLDAQPAPDVLETEPIVEPDAAEEA